MKDNSVYPVYDPVRVKLVAHVHERGQDTYCAEIVGAESSTRTAWVSVPGRLYHHAVPFAALQSVALVESNHSGYYRVLQAFGRPPLAESSPAPAWVVAAEMMV